MKLLAVAVLLMSTSVASAQMSDGRPSNDTSTMTGGGDANNQLPCMPIGQTVSGQLVYSMDCRGPPLVGEVNNQSEPMKPLAGSTGIVPQGTFSGGSGPVTYPAGGDKK